MVTILVCDCGAVGRGSIHNCYNFIIFIYYFLSFSVEWAIDPAVAIKVRVSFLLVVQFGKTTCHVQLLAHSKNELMRWRGVCRLSVCVSVNFFAGIAPTTPKVARSLPNLHRMVTTWARIQVVLKVEVKVKGHVIRAL